MPATLHEDPLHVERAAARACREYHATVGDSLPDLRARRTLLAEFAAQFYRDRLGISPTRDERTALSRLADPSTVVVEIAHDGQLPHLGVARMVLKAAEVARLEGEGVALYLVGNHYSAEMRPDNIHFGMPLRGHPPSGVKHPPKLPMGKSNAHKPFRMLDPPRETDLTALRAQLVDFVGHNIAYERKAGHRVPTEAHRTIVERLDGIFAKLNIATQGVASFGDWIIRVQHDLLLETFGREVAAPLLFLPMAEMPALLRVELELIARSAPEVSRIKAETSAEQASHEEEPYSRGPEPASFWAYCPSCGRRLRVQWSPGSSYAFQCPVCGHAQTFRETDAWRWMMPDIVAFQVALFRVGIDGWLAGSRAPYHAVIRRLTSHLFGVEAPPTFFLTSIPVFRGLGDPPEGFGKTRLLRALLEVEPAAVTESLRRPWDENPHLTSQFLTEQA